MAYWSSLYFVKFLLKTLHFSILVYFFFFSYENNYIVTKFQDIDGNNEETDKETQTFVNMTVSNSKNNSDISNNKKYVFPNVSYANILKQPSGMKRPSNIPAYVMFHLN